MLLALCTTDDQSLPTGIWKCSGSAGSALQLIDSMGRENAKFQTIDTSAHTRSSLIGYSDGDVEVGWATGGCITAFASLTCKTRLLIPSCPLESLHNGTDPAHSCDVARGDTCGPLHRQGTADRTQHLIHLFQHEKIAGTCMKE